MTAFNSPFRLYGGATRPDAISGLNAQFRTALNSLFNAAPESVRRELGLTSAYRSPEVQRELWNASDKTGRTVARPGFSLHNKGLAADLYGFGLKGGPRVSQETMDWVHQNAGQFGLNFPMKYEPWHIQIGGSMRDAATPPATAATASAPAGDVGGLARGSIMTAQNAPVTTSTPAASLITPTDSSGSPAPQSTELTGADKQKSIGGLLGELQKNAGGGAAMTQPDLLPRGGGPSGPSLSELVQQYISSQMRGQQQQQPPPPGGLRLG